MKREQKEFDAIGFLGLLGDSLQERWQDRMARTGVLTARIHFREGDAWAMSVQFDEGEERAA
jgi:hypothetical protein